MAKAKSAYSKLVGKVKAFVREYFVDFNQTQAYIRAGYKNSPAARAHASRLAAKGNVAAAISEQFDILGLSPERIKSGLAAIAFGDEPSKIVSEDSRVVRREQDKLGAVKELVRVRGLVTDKSEVKISGDCVVAFNEGELDAKLAKKREAIE